MACNHFKKFLVPVIVIAISTASVSAASLSDLMNQKEQTEDEIENLEEESRNLEDEKEKIEEELSGKEEELIELLSSIQIMEEEIESLENQIEETQEEYELAKENEEEQYEAMKKRIQYMYEKGDSTYTEVFIKAASFSDILNKMEYVEQLYEYDRKMLGEYQETKENLEEVEKELLEERSEQAAVLHGLEEEKDAAEEIFEELSEENEEMEDLLDSCYEQAEELSEKLKKQTQEIQDATSIVTDTSKLVANADGITGEDVVSYACQFVGNPYVWGGTSLTNGTDCSGFTSSVYSHFGYSIGRTSWNQRSAGIAVSSLSEALPGDLICYPGHVALYVGNGVIVHASTAATGIKYSNVNYRTYICIRRIIY